MMAACLANSGAEENVRDIVAQADIPMTMGHYLRSMKQLTNQWTPTNFRDERRQRLYLKDIDCPPEWQERLQKVIPPNLFYMNDNVEERTGKRHSSDEDMFQEVHSAAPAGDLMSSLPEKMRAQNLMCYIGHEGTYTPAHREMCASLGQNIMIDASGDENGEKPGSSIWFMTETKDREVIREYFLSMLGHDIEIEKHFAQINAWKKATFPVYIVEQKVGDFVLVPPLAPHQVWNRGTRTIKVAWNRTTVETLEMALHEALPKARLVCRDEQYKNKAIIFYTLNKYYKEMIDAEKKADIGLLGFGQDLVRNSTRMKQMAADFHALFRLFTEVLVDEMFATKEKDVEYIKFDSCVTCSYCRANIFNRFLTCKNCVRQLANGDEDTYDICMECYAMGRSCLCVSNLSWCEQWTWSDLVNSYEDWRTLIIKNDGYINLQHSPLPLELARRKSGKKSVAQICQEQLRRRPWKDLTKADKPEVLELSEPEVDENGKPKKKKGRKQKKGDVYRCHVCFHKDYTYRLAYCATPGCAEAYCFGVLYRAFDMMPQEVLQNERWLCPKCLGICNCAACRRAGLGNPYQPKNTLLGHDTRAVADDRSVESLVDFRVHNLSWLKNAGEESRNPTSSRMRRLQQQAESEKAKEADMASKVPVLPDRELADTLEAAIREPEPNAAGDHGAAHENGTNGVSHQNGDPLGVEVADMSMDDQSAYPDPSGLGHGHDRMLGMGYYDQDDSADRILFDPYQIPSAESMVVDDEPEMSEYFKKQLRLAKRRAKNDDDNDPDFAAPRTHHRKRQRREGSEQADAQQEALNNMDPALFADETMVDAPMMPAPQAVHQAQDSAEPEMEVVGDMSGHDEGDEQTQYRPYSPNRPALRHARPKTSYMEPDLPEEEFNEMLIPRSKRPPPGIEHFNPENATKDPLDLASAAVFAMSSNATPATVAPDEVPVVEKKRPERKPGRPRASDVAQAPAESSTNQYTRRGRGRPPRSSYACQDAEEDDGDDLDAELARQLDDFGEDGEVIEQPSTASSEAPAPKRRGRPPRSSLPQTSAAAEMPSESQFLSLAERMKLKGKKVRIGQRKSEPAPPYKPDEATPPARRVPNRQPMPPPPTRGGSTMPTRGRGRGRGRGRPRATRNVSVSSSPSGDDDEFNPDAPELEVNDDDDDASFQAAPSASSPPPKRAVAAPTVKKATPAPEPSPSPEAEPEQEAEQYPSPEPEVEPEMSPSVAPERSPSMAPEPAPEPSPSPAASPSPPPSPPKPKGPTIVRLMESDEEDFDYGISGSESEEEADRSVSSSDSDSDDEDIPATREALRGSGLAIRGGARGRGGSGRGRGRRRGRGRGG